MKRTMKEMYKEGRPYEKCLERGAEALNDAELLAVVIRTGTLGETAIDLAEQILSMRGFEGLAGLSRIPIDRLREFRGIGDVKAVQIKCIGELAARMAKAEAAMRLSFQDPATIADYYMEELRRAEQERLHVMFFNTKNRLISEKLIFKGTVNASIISPREIFIEALERHAVKLVMVHNHPSGDPAPSTDDVLMTHRISKAGEMIGIGLLDHVIIGDGCYISLREKGIINTGT